MAENMKRVCREFIRTRLACVFAVSLAALSLQGCNESAGTDDMREFDHEQFDVHVLRGDVLGESPIIGRPYGLSLSGDVLWVQDGAGDPELHALDVNTGQVIQSVGRRGSGPGEFKSVFGTSVMGGEPGSAWVFDVRLQRLTLVHPDKPIEGDAQIVRLDGAPRIVRALWLTPATIIGVNEDPATRFVRFDSTGSRIAAVAGSLLGDPSIPEAARRRATITGFQICSERSRGFAMVFGTAGRVELYAPSARLLGTASVPYPSQPRFTRDRNTGTPKRLVDRVWYTDCDATDRHVYALFAGRREKKFPPDEMTTSRFLHVFSWDDGSLVRVVRLDPPVGNIQVDPTETTLYGSSLLTSRIYRFQLPADP